MESKKYNRLTIIRNCGYYTSPSGRKDRKVICLCECGNKKIVRKCHLTSNRTKSCGCLHKEKSLINQKLCIRIGKDSHFYKHGMANTRFYEIWRGMLSRCYNKNQPLFKNYGGRGIVVCNRWKKFENFKQDMFNKYNDLLTIDRINVNGNYCKKNCKWSTKQEQSLNKRNTVYIKYNGIKKTRFQWAKDFGIKNKTLKDRIDKLGWSIENSLKTPLLNNKSRSLYKYK
jgi:hypothetical protein